MGWSFSHPLFHLILWNFLFWEVYICSKLNCMQLFEIMCKLLEHKSIKLFLNFPMTIFHIIHFQTLKRFFLFFLVLKHFSKRYVVGFSTIFQVMIKVLVFLPCDFWPCQLYFVQKFDLMHKTYLAVCVHLFCRIHNVEEMKSSNVYHCFLKMHTFNKCFQLPYCFPEWPLGY